MLEVEADQDFIDWFQGTTLADFENDNILLQYPRMLTQKENDTLQAGVKQRSMAISAYLKKRFCQTYSERKRDFQNYSSQDFIKDRRAQL